MNEQKTTTAIRAWLIVFIVGLVVAGATAFPLVAELSFGSWLLHGLGLQHSFPSFVAWIDRVNAGVETTNAHYPFILYGTDWLAFAHLMIAVAFIGPLRDPVRNIWVIQFGIIACVCVIPLAAIAGPIRGIPFGWELIDMSFGVVGIVPLLLVYRLVRRLEKLQSERARLELARLERARLERTRLERTRLEQTCPDAAPLDGSPRAAAAAGS